MRGDAPGRGRRWAAGVVGVGVVGVLALGGCAGAPEPEPSVSVAPSPTASPTPSRTPIAAPVRPPEMERPDEAGAVAAAEYFMELFAYVMATGDVTEWDAVSDPGCEFCAGVRSDVTRVYSGGGWFEGLRLALDGADVLGYDDVLNGYGVGVNFALPTGTERDAHGDVVAERTGESGVAVVDVSPTRDGWRLVGLSLLTGEP